MGRESTRKVDGTATRYATRKVDHDAAAAVYHLGMRPITDIRRDRLRQMIDEVADGNQAQFAEMIGKSRAYVGFWLTDPSKPHAKQISHEVAREVEAEMRRRGNKQYAAGWLDSADESHSEIPDPDRLGHALTSIDKVIRKKGLVMEGRLGKYRKLLAYAYALQDDELFPNGISDSTSPAERKRYDDKVLSELGGMMKRGEVETVRKAATGSVAGTGAGAAKGKKAGSSRA